MIITVIVIIIIIIKNIHTRFNICILGININIIKIPHRIMEILKKRLKDH